MRVPPWLLKPDLARRESSTADRAEMDIDGLRVTLVSLDEHEIFGPSVTLTFDAASADRLAAFTTAHAGVRVQVLVDEVVVYAPRIVAPITGGVVVASMGTDEQAMRLAKPLSLPGAILSLRIAH